MFSLEPIFLKARHPVIAFFIFLKLSKLFSHSNNKSWNIYLVLRTVLKSLQAYLLYSSQDSEHLFYRCGKRGLEMPSN